MFAMLNGVHVSGVHHASYPVGRYLPGWLGRNLDHVGNRFGWPVVIEDLEVA